MKRFLWLGLVLCLHLICSGCGETFRPIILPNPPVFPNPRAAHTVLSINDNGTVVPGTTMVVDVSGDTDISVSDVGVAPVHAVQQTASQVLVVNQSTVCNPVPCNPSITKVTFSSILISGSSTISLPPNSAPNFIATTESTQAYVTLPGYAPPSVGVVNTNSNSLVNTIPVGINPVAIAETPNSQKLYVANQGDSTVSGVNTVDRSARTINGTLTFPPIWLVARSDSQRVYVLEETSGIAGGTLGSIDTTSTAGPDTLAETSISVPTAAKLVYDSNLNRLYIPGDIVVQVHGVSVLESAVVIVDVSQSQPSTIASILVNAVPPLSRGASDPCSGTTATTLINIDAASLPDGSRAYVGSYYEDAVNGVNYICPQVTVIDNVSNTIKSQIAIPGIPAFDTFCTVTPTSRSPRFRLMMAAAGDSSRAYLSSCDGGNVNIIDTTTDSYTSNLPAPAGSRLQNPPQSPVFLIAGP
jgi:DNA-binding beta-propeller fold protein YncE